MSKHPPLYKPDEAARFLDVSPQKLGAMPAGVFRLWCIARLVSIALKRHLISALRASIRLHTLTP